MKIKLIKISIAILMVASASCSSTNNTFLFKTPSAILYDKLNTENDTLKVVVIGGSITWGAGATIPWENSWSYQLKTQLEKKHFKKVELVNLGIGATGSDFGLYRIADVLKYHPDLVIVEFAVNDNLFSKEEIEFTHSTLFQSLYSSGCAVLWLNLKTEIGESASDKIHLVTDNYLIPMSEPNLKQGDYVDGIHPNDVGHTKISNQIFSALTVLKSNPQSKFYGLDNVFTKLKPLNFKRFDIDLEKIGWEKEKGPYYFDNIYKSVAKSDTLEFEFEGSSIGLVLNLKRLLDVDKGVFKAVIDGGNEIDINLAWNNDWELIKPCFLAENLKEGKHNLRLVYTQNPSSNNVSAIEIINLLASGAENISVTLLE